MFVLALTGLLYCNKRGEQDVGTIIMLYYMLYFIKFVVYE